MSFFSSLWKTIWAGPQALSDTASALFAFFTTITDYTMWRSLGWLLLGVVLIAFGLFIWGKTTVLNLAV